MVYNLEWSHTRKDYRLGVTKALDAIRQGSIEELDLDKLHNFCMVALMLMSKVQEPVWRKSEKDAEIAGLLHKINTSMEREKENANTSTNTHQSTGDQNTVGNQFYVAHVEETESGNDC